MPSVPEYVEAGGWFFREKDLSLVLQALQPPPRQYGVLDHVMTDLRAGRPIVVWGLLTGALIFGLIARQWLIAALGGAGLLFFARGAWQVIRLARRGLVQRGRVERIDKHHGFVAEAHGVEVGGVAMTVMVDPKVVGPLLQRRPVDVLVLYDPKAAKPCGQALGFRPAEDAAVDLRSLRESVARIAR